MVSVETIDFGQFGQFKAANISGVVGEGLTNDRSDVLLIQTLFKIIGGENEVFSRALIGMEPSELPALSGNCDRQTLKAIWSYQRRRRHRLLGVDGKVHPGKFENRVIKEGPEGRQMMITLLNMNAAQIGGHTDLPSVVRRISPSIVFGNMTPKPGKP